MSARDDPVTQATETLRALIKFIPNVPQTDRQSFARTALSVLVEENERLRDKANRYRIEGDQGHDDYEDAEAVIIQIAEGRPNKSFDPWARDLCREFLDRPRRSRTTIADIRGRAEAAEARVQELTEALRQIAYEMPTSERNPDGDEQAAHSMQLAARAALDGKETT